MRDVVAWNGVYASGAIYGETFPENQALPTSLFVSEDGGHSWEEVAKGAVLINDLEVTSSGALCLVGGFRTFTPPSWRYVALLEADEEPSLPQFDSQKTIRYLETSKDESSLLAVSVGPGTDPEPVLSISSDGTEWNQGELPDGLRGAFAFSKLDDGEFMIGSFAEVADAWTIFHSVDGIEWSADDSTEPGFFVRDLAFGADRWLAIGGSVAYSEDGSSWVDSTGLFGGPYHGAAFGNGIFVAAQWNGTVWTSVDGEEWDDKDLVSFEISAVDFENGVFFLLGKDGRTAVSRDAEGWLFKDVPVYPGSSLHAVAYFNGRYWVGGEYGQLYSSPASKWLEAQPVVGEPGWLEHAAFGRFYERQEDNWFFHGDYGWMWLHGVPSGGIHLYHPESGWIWTDLQIYFPWVYHFDEGWIWTPHETYPWVYSGSAGEWRLGFISDS